MAYAVEHGIPYSILLGRVWPNPDDPLEAQWLRSDVNYAVMYRQHESERCLMCGSLPREWPDDTRQDPPYIAQPYRCAGCAEIADERDGVPNGREGHGVYVRLERFDREQIERYEREAEQRRIAKAKEDLDSRKLIEPGPLAVT